MFVRDSRDLMGVLGVLAKFEFTGGDVDFPFQRAECAGGVLNFGGGVRGEVTQPLPFVAFDDRKGSDGDNRPWALFLPRKYTNADGALDEESGERDDSAFGDVIGVDCDFDDVDGDVDVGDVDGNIVDLEGDFEYWGEKGVGALGCVDDVLVGDDLEFAGVGDACDRGVSCVCWYFSSETKIVPSEL